MTDLELIFTILGEAATGDSGVSPYFTL